MTREGIQWASVDATHRHCYTRKPRARSWLSYCGARVTLAKMEGAKWTAVVPRCPDCEEAIAGEAMTAREAGEVGEAERLERLLGGG